MKKRLVSVVLVAAFAFSMLAGCGSDNSASKDNNKTSAEAEQTATNSGDGFNITVNFASEPMTMDPALNSSVDGAIMANHLFEGAQVRKLKVLTEHAIVQNLLTVRLRAMTKQQMMMEL